MTDRITNIKIEDLTYQTLTTEAYKDITVDELKYAFNRLENHYKPIENELKQTKHERDQLKQQRWKHYKIIGWEKLLIILTFAITITTLINNACNN